VPSVYHTPQTYADLASPADSPAPPANSGTRKLGFAAASAEPAPFAEQCLPPELLAAFQATCGQASTRLTVVSERLRVLKETAASEGQHRYDGDSTAGDLRIGPLTGT
jgi:hypothetical protein